MIDEWYNVTYTELIGLWQAFLAFIPKFLVALVTFLIGWFIASVIGKLVSRVLDSLKINQIFEQTNWREALEAAEIKLKITDFIGAIIKWILVIVFLSIAVYILDLREFAALLTDLVKWLPNVVVAVVIFVVAVIISDLLNRIIRASVKKMGVGYAGFLGTLVRWAIFVFAGVAILQQLQIVVADWIANMLTIAFAGIVFAASLAFGLGGKDAAARFIEDLRRKVSEH